MKILEYNDLDTSKIRRQYEKISGFLEKDDFRSAEVKKLPEYDLYRAKLDDTNRLLFKLVKYQGAHYALILEVVLNHAYDRAKFLRGAKIDETRIARVDDKAQINDGLIFTVLQGLSLLPALFQRMKDIFIPSSGKWATPPCNCHILEEGIR